MFIKITVIYFFQDILDEDISIVAVCESHHVI